jgi:N-acetylmuramoyl-L-alanine amidase
MACVKLPMRCAAAALAALLAFGLPAAALARDAPTVVGIPPKPLRNLIIALDPGHNGGNASHPAEIATLVWIGNQWKPCNKVGTSTSSGYSEHAFNFDVALRTKWLLESLGATVYMTRTSDTGVGPCINVRGQFGKKVGAVVEISIHADGAATSNRGFFVMKPGLVVGWTDDILTASGRLATAMRDGIAGVGLPIANYYATNGIKTRTDLGTLNCSDVPVVELEMGNMKNAADARLMTSTSGRALYAKGIVAGIRRYLGK